MYCTSNELLMSAVISSADENIDRLNGSIFAAVLDLLYFIFHPDQSDF
jgi:hypothetical protein